jgi:hypothetical protein
MLINHFFFFNTLLEVQINIAMILGFERSFLPYKYLGSPLLDKDIQNTSWKELLEKLEAKLTKCTHRFLTFPKRILLIKSMIICMPLYLFLILDAPKGILKKIRNLQRAFPWGGSTK